MKSETVSIGTWPTPEKPLTLKIPTKILTEFRKDPRIVIRHPWTVGIPVPEMLIIKMLRNRRAYADVFRKFELMFVPKEPRR